MKLTRMKKVEDIHEKDYCLVNDELFCVVHVYSGYSNYNNDLFMGHSDTIVMGYNEESHKYHPSLSEVRYNFGPGTGFEDIKRVFAEYFI